MAENTSNQIRYDNAQLKITEKGDGFLRADVTMVEAGVYPYMSSDGKIVMEAKLPEEIFDALTISTADGLVVTTNHPPREDSRGLVKPSNFKKYIQGVVSSPRRVGNKLVGTETIFDAELIQNVSVGDLLEVSLGQEVVVDAASGEYNGVRYAGSRAFGHGTAYPSLFCYRKTFGAKPSAKFVSII